MDYRGCLGNFIDMLFMRVSVLSTCIVIIQLTIVRFSVHGTCIDIIQYDMLFMRVS